MKKLNILLFVVLTMLFLSACGSSDEESDSEKNSSDSGESENSFDLVEDGKLTIASSGEFKPFSYMEGSEMIGYDVAVGEAIAEKLGLEAVQKKAKFSGIVTGVNQGRYDIAVASHTITDERLEKVDFSEAYYYSGPVIYTRPDSDIKSAEDLNGKEISVSRGSTYVEMAEEYTENIPQVDSDVVALQSLAKGHHDAVITDDITGLTAIDSGLEIENRGQLGISEQAVAVQQGNDKLLEAVNKALQEMKESGELAELSKEWIGVDITQEPEDVTE
ncbi:amino acid ABC transporter substrate-binding protein [Virgibacillus profundi]|uniref:Amino acid ABC transporter substrate-binding protein n=1 Tax=Virgibacillus profundi TaxID=2024555 RepID=A0A2A2I992_9BACI|nr:transporter substrate-binding domain-containing protein [Virgibacillus profundi]PAV27705.1 amino acid ABC transporter substrate-binding protein [Virgibacillus profundi]PXY51860.1 amino acid ABC transporter substrate-binding protein [Virgibacillus profundi]